MPLQRIPGSNSTRQERPKSNWHIRYIGEAACFLQRGTSIRHPQTLSSGNTYLSGATRLDS